MARDSDAQLLSPLPIEACLRLLDERIESAWKFSGSRPLIGSLRGTTMRATKRIPYRNSFQTQLTARLSTEGDGTLIACSFAMNPFVVVFMTLWFTLVVTFGGAAMVAVLYDLAKNPQRASHQEWAAVFVPLTMLVGGAAMVWIGRGIARNERDELLTLVTTLLQATPRR